MRNYKPRHRYSFCKGRRRFVPYTSPHTYLITDEGLSKINSVHNPDCMCRIYYRPLHAKPSTDRISLEELGKKHGFKVTS